MWKCRSNRIDKTDESKVLNSHYFSSYKGKITINAPMDASASFGIIIMGKNSDANTVKHEYGHTVQLENMGVR